IVGQNSAAIFEHGKQLLLAVFLLHAGGFALGYFVTRLFRYDSTTARTVSIEVGMQNSGLGAVLAKTHFAANPLTAVPAALSSVCHSLLGSLLAGVWRVTGSKV
ncbi:MAG: bile acid:sodium symporter family protein, partial [Chthoniobacterales bacterium]